jgi:hypothetical protein
MEALIPFMIASVSLTGAAVTWRASELGSQAAELDAQVVREATEEQQIMSQLNAEVEYDRRVFADYQEHILAWRTLAAHAEEMEASDPDLARAMTYESQARLAMARTLRSLFRAVRPDFGDEAGHVEYDEERALQGLIESDERLLALDPEETQSLASARHAQAIQMVAVVILMVGALFLLTVAQLGKGIMRIWFGGLGAVAATVALVAFLMVQVGFM